VPGEVLEAFKAPVASVVAEEPELPPVTPVNEGAVHVNPLVPPVVLSVRVIEIVDPLHIVGFELVVALATGVGLTVMLLLLVPVHVTPLLVYWGVTVIVETTGAVPPLVPVKDAMFPVPLTGIPVLVLVAVHGKANVPPLAVLPRVIAATVPLLQTV
jgi:hypothetical protein